MPKTPDEIKKGLEEEIPVHYHIDGEPRLTPRLLMDMQWLHKDTIALIQQLQADLEDMTARYKIADDCAKKKGEMNEKLYAELTAAKAERDAAVAALKSNCVCTECKWYDDGLLEGHCNDCHYKNSSFEWRGVQKD